MQYHVTPLRVFGSLGSDIKAYVQALVKQQSQLVPQQRFFVLDEYQVQQEPVFAALVPELHGATDDEALHRLIDESVRSVETHSAQDQIWFMLPTHMPPAWREVIALYWQCLSPGSRLIFIEAYAYLSELLMHRAMLPTVLLGSFYSSWRQDVFATLDVAQVMTPQNPTGSALGTALVWLKLSALSHQGGMSIAAQCITLSSVDSMQARPQRWIDCMQRLLTTEQVAPTAIKYVLHVGFMEHLQQLHISLLKQHFWPTARHAPRLLSSHSILGDVAQVNTLFLWVVATELLQTLQLGDCVLIIENSHPHKFGLILLKKA
jgi:hypothetical protein